MKKNRFIGLLLLSFLMCIGMAMAVLNAPTTGSTVTGDPFTIRFNTSGTNVSYVNYTLVVGSPLSGNTSVVYANVTNTTYSQGNVTFFWNSSGVRDANDYSVTVTAFNASGFEAFTNTGVIVDFTTPATPSSLTSGAQTSSSVTLTATLGDATTTSCSVSFQGQIPVSSAPTCTYATSTATVTMTDVNEGAYGYIITASDETQSSASATTYFTVDLGKGGKRPAQAQVAGQQGQDIAQQAKEGASKIGVGFRNIVASIIAKFKALFA